MAWTSRLLPSQSRYRARATWLPFGWARVGMTPKVPIGVRGLPTRSLPRSRKGALRTSGRGSCGEAASDEEHAEPVVLAVAEAAGEAPVELDDPVDGLRAAVR